MCVHILSYTTQHRTIPIIFPVILQTIIIAQMMSTEGQGRQMHIICVIYPPTKVVPFQPHVNGECCCHWEREIANVDRLTKNGAENKAGSNM